MRLEQPQHRERSLAVPADSMVPGEEGGSCRWLRHLEKPDPRVQVA